MLGPWREGRPSGSPRHCCERTTFSMRERWYRKHAQTEEATSPGIVGQPQRPQDLSTQSVSAWRWTGVMIRTVRPSMRRARGLKSRAKYVDSSGTYGTRSLQPLLSIVGQRGRRAQYAVYRVGKNVQSRSTCDTFPVMMESAYVVTVVAAHSFRG
jgi:hypothetical protein